MKWIGPLFPASNDLRASAKEAELDLAVAAAPMTSDEVLSPDAVPFNSDWPGAAGFETERPFAMAAQDFGAAGAVGFSSCFDSSGVSAWTLGLPSCLTVSSELMVGLLRSTAPSLGKTGRTGNAGTALRVVVFDGCVDTEADVVFCDGERWAVVSGVLVVDASVATLTVDVVVSVKLESSRSSITAGFSDEALTSTVSAGARPAEASAWEICTASVVVACEAFFFLLGLLLLGQSSRGWVDQGI